MRNKKCMKIMLCLSGMMLVFSSCKFVREEDIGNIIIGGGDNTNGNIPTKGPNNLLITENPVTIVVESGSVIDEEALLDYFYGQSKKELIQGGYLIEETSRSTAQLTAFSCIKDGMDLSYIYEYGMNSNYIYFMDDRERAGNRYEDVLEDKFIDNEISKNLMDMYPKGELEGCSVEEVIAACQPLAQACGYGEAQVDVYVMKSEVLNNYAQQVGRDDITFDMFRSAPDSDYDYNYVNELERKIKQEATKEDANGELLESLLVEMDTYISAHNEKQIEWTKKNDAYLLVYQLNLNGRLVDSKNYSLICVYVPAYERIVFAEGHRSLVVTETLEEVPLVTKEEAVLEMLRVLKIASMDDITITNISMVYSPRYEQANHELERRTIDPCWRIDYELSESLRDQPLLYNDDDGTIFINAVDGRENKYPRG